MHIISRTKKAVNAQIGTTFPYFLCKSTFTQKTAPHRKRSSVSKIKARNAKTAEYEVAWDD